MEFLLMFVFAVVFAMGFNYFMPMVIARPEVSKYTGSYAGQTAITAVLVFALLVAVGFVFSLVGAKAKVGTVAV